MEKLCFLGYFLSIDVFATDFLYTDILAPGNLTIGILAFNSFNTDFAIGFWHTECCQ